MSLQQLLSLVGGVVVVCLSWSTAIYLMTTCMLGRRVRSDAWARYSLVFFLIQLVMNALLWFGIMPYHILVWDVGLFTIQNLILVFFLYRAYREAPLKTFSAAALSHFVVYTCHSIIDAAVRRIYPADSGMDLARQMLIYDFIPHLLMCAFALLTALILKRVRFYKYFAYLFTTGRKAALTFGLCLLLMNSHALIAQFLPGLADSVAYSWTAFAAILLALFSLQIAAMIASGRRQLRIQEETILQQQAHLRLLEELQGEIKAFRHDFQNLLSGMALQAHAGDVEGVKAFLQSTTGYFDQKLGNEIKQMSALFQVDIYPLRSLLALKLAAMRELDIGVQLEILLPVNRCGLKEEDLVRCAGILLDNAAEAAARQQGGLVRVLLLQEERELRIAVSNTCPEKPDLNAMQTPGHTTKGGGRGAGLSSYRRILAGYPGCVTRTLWKDGMLTQELRTALE